MPKRSRSGVASRPARVVAPTSVNGEQVDAHRARRRPLADDQVELEVFHRRVEHFLDRGLQAMDLVDEQDIPGLEVCQDCGEVAGPLDHRPRGGAEADAQLAGDDLRQRGLAEAGRAVQQHVVQRLAAGAGGLDEHREVLARGLLADELGEGLRAQAGLRRILLAADGGDGAGLVAHPGAFCASSFRLSRITASSGAASPSRSIVRATIGCASCRR